MFCENQLDFRIKHKVHKELVPGTIRKDIASVDKIIKNVDEVFQSHGRAKSSKFINRYCCVAKVN